LSLTDENDVVFDPYAGVASSLIAAIMHNRTAVGVDSCQEYVDIGRRRIEMLLNGILKTRPMGKPVYEPTGKEKIARIPFEWLREGSVY
jgi:adenine-specific DNA-methyltransferase